jgi:hypothetical protein
MAGALCGHVRRHPSEESPVNSTVFAMYMPSRSEGQENRAWWELDSSSWAGGWTPCGSTGTRRQKAEPVARFYFPTTGRIPTLLPRMGHRKQDPQAGRWLTTAGAARLEMDGRTRRSLVDTHCVWVGVLPYLTKMITFTV